MGRSVAGIERDSMLCSNLLFSVSQQCRGSGFGFSFYGRQRGEPDNVSVTVWFEGSRLTRVGP